MNTEHGTCEDCGEPVAQADANAEAFEAYARIGGCDVAIQQDASAALARLIRRFPPHSVADIGDFYVKLVFDEEGQADAFLEALENNG